MTSVDARLIERLDTNMWRLAATYLPAYEIPNLAICCSYFRDEVIWHKHSAQLLWAELPQLMMIRSIRPNRVSRAPTNQIQSLIEAKADVNTLGWNWNMLGDMTALMVASDADITKLLIAAKADVNMQDDCGQNALMVMCQEGYVESAKMLIAAGTNVNVSDKWGTTALMFARESMCAGNIELLRMLYPSSSS
jgi:hypothetical protein